ncbi:hypothetical protein [Clostridium sp. UBA1652]|uniref:hypothetical protein n=1 Tax=Clostridium sp. UBA1652 TaxID=1946348 RepID=UPI00257F73E7|nr:hypothetical protein [Clostridium sp. UBA1652]
MKFKDVNLQYKNYWIEPFIDTFKPIGIHEAVYKEFESNSIKKLIDSKVNDVSPSIYIYYDSNAIRLVEDAEKLDTSLEQLSAIKPYEVIYYFIKNDIGDKEKLRFIYKYLYYLTKKDKHINPSWGEFIEKMDILYCG